MLTRLRRHDRIAKLRYRVTNRRTLRKSPNAFRRATPVAVLATILETLLRASLFTRYGICVNKGKLHAWPRARNGRDVSKHKRDISAMMILSWLKLSAAFEWRERILNGDTLRRNIGNTSDLCAHLARYIGCVYMTKLFNGYTEDARRLIKNHNPKVS